jgi:DNA-binding GntR family transcriptional regulator
MTQLAYHFLKERIKTAELPVGVPINEREIAEQLDISRTPVREAILLLQKEGFVEISPRRGIRVLPLLIEDMREVYEIITALETLAVGLAAARRLGEEGLRPLRDTVREMETALDKDDLAGWTSADERFHRILLELSGNRRLAQLGLSYRDQMHRAQVVVMRLRPRPTRSARAHRGLIELIRRGDVEGARQSHYGQRLRGGEEHMATVHRYGLKSL